MQQQTCTSARKKAGTFVNAFSLIEIMIGLFIIGLGASLVVPRLLRRSPSTEWPAVQLELNALLFFARQEAIVTQKIHRLTFAEKARTVTVEIPDGEEKPGVIKYSQVSSLYVATQYELPESIRFDSVKLDKKNMFDEHKGKAFCYVIPNGLIQEVCVTLVRNEAGVLSKKIYNAAPFLGTFDDSEDQL